MGHAFTKWEDPGFAGYGSGVSPVMLAARHDHVPAPRILRGLLKVDDL
jgi:hypothetical protein